MTADEARRIAGNIIIETVTAIGDQLDGHALVAAYEPMAEASAPDVAHVAHLIDTALVEVTIDWIGGRPS